MLNDHPRLGVGIEVLVDGPSRSSAPSFPSKAAPGAVGWLVRMVETCDVTVYPTTSAAADVAIAAPGGLHNWLRRQFIDYFEAADHPESAKAADEMMRLLHLRAARPACCDATLEPDSPTFIGAGFPSPTEVADAIDAAARAALSMAA